MVRREHFFVITGILLVLFVSFCHARGLTTRQEGCKLQTEAEPKSSCRLYRELMNKAQCSFTSKTTCDDFLIIGENSTCSFLENLRVCKAGKWTETETSAAVARHKRSALLIAGAVVGGAALGAAIACAFLCKEEKQNRPPSLHSCPTDISVDAPAGAKEAVVSWNVPTASDPDGDRVTIEINGPAPGSTFQEGAVSITYRAKDDKGFTDHCFFLVRVTVKECSPPSYVLHGTQTCDKGFIYGSICSHTCEPGYQLTGSSDVSCQADEQWSGQFPTCEPVSCGPPKPVIGGRVDCWSPDHVYPEFCSVTCDRGFYPSGSVFVACRANANWTTADSCDDVESPKFPIGCPANLQLHSGPLESPVVVTWPDPVTTDNGGGHVTLTSMPAMGSSLALGFHLVRVTATDESANSASCNFLVVVQARKCPSLSPPAYGRVTCTHGQVEGSECTVTCYPGYEVKGNATLKCLDTELWNVTLPTCETVSCPILPQVNNGSFSCSAGQQYPAACSLLCDEGFSTHNHTFIQCRADGTWSTPGWCRDTKGPDFANVCADNIEIYQARLGSPTLVQWNPPAVTDNSGGPVQLESDIPSGSEFQRGVTWVTYTATDLSNNSRTCRFSVTVSTLMCDPPDLDNTDNGIMLYDCPSGHVHGAICTLDCSYGYPLVGSNTITCERDDSTFPPSTKWEWPGPSAVPPVCRENNCSSLANPQNGALACHLGNFGWDCQMFCHEDWDVPAQTEGHFYCTNSDNFWNPSQVPDCLVRIIFNRVRLNTELFYFTNSCDASEAELKEKFLERMNSSQWRDSCINSCHLENLQVTCGSLGRRRRRSADDDNMYDVSSKMEERLRIRRQAQTHFLHVTFEIAVEYNETSTTRELLYKAILAMQEAIFGNLTQEANSGLLDFDDATAAQYSVAYPKLRADCPAGTIFVARDYGDTVSCAGCGAGYYLPVDNTTGVQASSCQACPVGTYTDQDISSTCTPCPAGSKTLTTASTSIADCKLLCPAGNFSYNGYLPCQPCPNGRYQSGTGASACDLCPAGTWTETIGATSLDQCIPVDVMLGSTSSLGANVSSAWAELTMTSWVQVSADSAVSLTVALDTGSDGPVSLTLYSGSPAAGNVPANSSSSVSLEVEADFWSRVMFVLDPGTATTSVFVQRASVLSYTHSALSASMPTTFTLVSQVGRIKVSGLHASNQKPSPADTATLPSTCAGNVLDNLLTWSPASTILTFPSECDAVDECEGDPCGAHPCENQAGSFVCHCQDGYSGSTCSTPPDPCLQHECLNNGTCVPAGPTNYTCTCPSAFIGTLCQIPIVDGGWGEWSPWEPCSATCGGGGQQQRQRLCDNPAPLNGGSTCTGAASETVSCGDPFCAVNGNWSDWGPWGSCNATCGGGVRFRERTCDNPATAHGGEDCGDSAVEQEACNVDPCPVDGGWSQWAIWTQCSVTCGVGSQSRARTCTNPPPANAGDPCSGASNQTQACNSAACPECPPLVSPTAAQLNCTDTTSPFLRTCVLTCDPGYVSAATLPQYKCGEETGYLWSHQKDSTTSTAVPDTCKRATTATAASLSLSIPVNVGCDATTAAAVKSGIEQNIATSVACVQQNECQTLVTTSCSPSGTLVLSVQLTSDFGSNRALDLNDTTMLQEYVNVLNLADQSVVTLVLNPAPSLFTATVGSQAVTADLASLAYTAALTCPSGSGAVRGVCAECPAGYKEESGQCTPCPFGEYQDQVASTSCKPCPAGLTWDVLGATSISQCVYPFTTTTTPTTSGTTDTTQLLPGPPPSSSDGSSTLPLVIGVICASVVSLGLAITFAVYKCKKNNTLTKMRTRRASLLSWGRVTPDPISSRPASAASWVSSPPSYSEAVKTSPSGFASKPPIGLKRFPDDLGVIDLE